jgi:hypothetical protein
MCTEVRDTLNRLPGVKAQALGGDRISATLTMSSGHFDADQLRRHPLIKHPDVPKEPGVRSTVCLDECTNTITLASYFPQDLETVIMSAYTGPVPV